MGRSQLTWIRSRSCPGSQPACFHAGQAFEDGLGISPLGLGLSAAFAIIIGLSAGLFPALRASRLTPVEAIRGA